MNKTLSISVVALVAVIMILGTVSQAMAVPPIDSDKVKPHSSGHTKGDAVDCDLRGESGKTGKLWFVDIDNDDDHDHDPFEPTMCLRPR